MKHGHPSREYARGKEKRDEMEHLKHQAKAGVEHLREHHHEERREIDRGHMHERGHEKGRK